MYTIFVILHVFCASMAIALLPFSLLMRGRIKRSAGTPVELSSMATLGYIGKTLGMIGGLGLLITGAGAAGIGHLPWFDFAEQSWLAYKQTLYIIIITMNFALVIPKSKKMGKLIAERMSTGGAGGATEEIRALGGKIGMLTMIMHLLTLTAMVFGVSKGVF